MQTTALSSSSLDLRQDPAGKEESDNDVITIKILQNEVLLLSTKSDGNSECDTTFWTHSSCRDVETKQWSFSAEGML